MVRSWIRFPNGGDGVIPFEIIAEEGYHRGSELASGYEAPDIEYEVSYEWIRYSKKDASVLGGHRVRNDYTKTRAYYFRVNTVMDEEGNVISANYGKIYGDLSNQILTDGRAWITWGTHYYNPEVNDRRVEFDRTRPLPDSLLDEQRERRARHLRKGIKEDEGPLMLKNVRP